MAGEGRPSRFSSLVHISYVFTEGDSYSLSLILILLWDEVDFLTKLIVIHSNTVSLLSREQLFFLYKQVLDKQTSPFIKSVQFFYMNRVFVYPLAIGIVDTNPFD